MDKNGMGLDDQRVYRMLDLYCAWLNQFDTLGHVYKPEQFMVMDRSKDLWGGYLITATYQTPWYYCVAVRVDDGDDGGAAFLTGYFHREIGLGYANEIGYMTQEFDTDIRFVVKEGNIVKAEN